MKYRISDILEHQEWRRKLNSCDIRDIQFIQDDGAVLQVSDEIYHDWRFTGLSNIDFIDLRYWEEPKND